MSIDIILSSDNSFTQHLGVTLCSLFENNKETNIKIYVIDGGIKLDNKDRLAQLEKKYSFNINYVEPEKELFKDLFVSGHMSIATYYRLCMGELIPPSKNKVLYLDCDIIILGNIEELWNQDLSGFTLGAISEAGHADYKSLGIVEKNNYFNAGILLVDLKKWREQQIGKRCFDFIKKNPDKIIIYDQDALNGVFRGNWKKLDARFNVMTQDKKMIANPMIIHFNTWIKPWNYLCNNPHKGLYLKYLRLSPWKDYKPKFPSIIEIIRYYYNILIEEKIRIDIRKHILNIFCLKKR